MHKVRIYPVILFVAAALVFGCTKKKTDPGTAPGERAVDTSAEAQAADQGWIVGVARDNGPLLKLAESSAGWGAFFGNELIRAVELFQKDARGNKDARIGGARAALRLARAYHELSMLQEALVEPYHKAQASRPDASKNLPWRRYVEGRLAQRLGNDTKARSIFDGVKESPLGELARAAMAQPGEGGSAGPLADLLAGREAGANTEASGGMSQEYFARLRVRSLSSARRSRLALKIWGRLDHRGPDLAPPGSVAKDGFWDPLAAEAGQRLYAAVALEFMKGETEWSPLYEAEAYLLLARPDAALTALNGLLKAPPKEARLANLVLSRSQGIADMLGLVKSLKVQTLVRLGKADEAKVLISDMGQETIAQRVRRATALSVVGESSSGVFPDDRGELANLINSRVAALGKTAKGATDVAELVLVERFVDGLQRDWADVLARSDKPAKSARERSLAEDKTKAFAVSARNSVSSLIASSRAALRIGQYRVALKYLSRLDEKFPAAVGVSEQLRDILSYRAMAREGGVTTGQ